MSNLPLIESLADFWERVDYIGLFLVFVGVVLESLVEFTGLINSSTWKSKIGKLSALVLIVGLALELMASARLADLNRQVVTILSERTADAEKRASHAEKATEDERAERLKLEFKVESQRRNGPKP